MAKISFAEAFFEGLKYSVDADERVNFFGGTLFGLVPDPDLQDRVRAKIAGRVIEPPCSEIGAAALAIGAAMAGDRVFYTVGTASFLFEAWPQIVNEAANACYMSGGQLSVPAVFHVLHGLRGGSAAQHGHSPQSMLANCPGLQIVVPSTPQDVKGLVRTALRSNNPTVLLTHALLFRLEEEVPEGDYSIPFGVADVKREGSDVTIVATSLMVSRALEAADLLAQEGIDAEVVDPRTIAPLDRASILKSVAKTGRLVVVDEANTTCSIASEISATVAEDAFYELKAPIQRVCRPDVPVPFSPELENYLMVTADKIVLAARSIVQKASSL